MTSDEFLITQTNIRHSSFELFVIQKFIWESLEAHTIGFRESELFKEWRGLIGPFFENPPVMLHYEDLGMTKFK